MSNGLFERSLASGPNTESLNKIPRSKYFLSLNFCPSWHKFHLPLFDHLSGNGNRRAMWETELEKIVNFRRIGELRTFPISKYFPFLDEYIK